MKDFFSTTGTLIATYIGTLISVISAIVAVCGKKAVIKYRNEIFTRFQSNEIAKLCEKGNKAKDIVLNYSSKTRKTSNGLNESKDKTFIHDFLTEINENKHLLKQETIGLVLSAKKYLTENNYDDLIYCISDIISELKELSVTNFIR